MPFVEINVKNEIEKQRQNNPEFKKAWDESRAEYKLITYCSSKVFKGSWLQCGWIGKFMDAYK